ncbi:biotin/lipoyl-binding protein [Stratiformator vulcanicus]|uniref:Peptide zinc metalloprotease protein YydH n=1 Tax=Stratiformator vulcanicus TaxID=2527980 RepID=A0A517QZ89_9PLAN|nr:biotin/lipoyl-binding protein [Stratiformator vulcanicus]QDT36952.1 Putative peptide zinc metalloprotease protein YydH [Stratiformator vulcanicus]
MSQLRGGPTLLPPNSGESSSEAFPLRCRTDLQYREVVGYADSFVVVKDPVGLKYFRLRPDQVTLLRSLDGRSTLEDVRRNVMLAHPNVYLTPKEVQQAVADLHEKGLLRSDRSGLAPAQRRKSDEQKRQKLFGSLLSVLFLRLPGWYPDRMLRSLLPFCGWLFHPVVVTLCVLFVVGSWGFALVNFDDVRRQLPTFGQFFGPRNLLYLWATIAITKFLHEMGHGLTCRRFGAECHEMGVMLLIFSPTLYCDVSDSWMLPSRAKRMMIAAAGMYVELILSGIGLLVWWSTDSGTLHFLALNLFLTTAVSTVIFNANPLMRLDGYYILSDFLGIPNLGSRANERLRKSTLWLCLGIENREPTHEDENGKGWLLTYAVLALAYRFVLAFGILIMLRQWLLPQRLDDLVTLLMCFVVFSFLAKPIMQGWKMWKNRGLTEMKWSRLIGSAVVLTGLGLAAVFVPIPWYAEAPIVAEPYDVRHVRTVVGGRLLAVHARPGDSVEQGAVIAELENTELQDRLDQVEADIAVQKAQIRVAQYTGDVVEKALSRDHFAALTEQQTQLKAMIALLTIRAPVSGTVIAGPVRKEPTPAAQQEGQPVTWSGRPTDRNNAGAFLESATHLVSIAPSDGTQVLLHFDQAELEDVHLGEEVTLRFESIPDRLYNGRVESVGAEGQVYIEPALATKYGGVLATEVDEQGRERLAEPVYVGRVRLDDADASIVPGTRGQALFTRSQRPVARWAWRAFRRVFSMI